MNESMTPIEEEEIIEKCSYCCEYLHSCEKRVHFTTKNGGTKVCCLPCLSALIMEDGCYDEARFILERMDVTDPEELPNAGEILSLVIKASAVSERLDKIKRELSSEILKEIRQ